MNEYELYQKLKELSKLMNDFSEGKIQESEHDWKKDILKESQEILKKSHVMGAIGSACSCCGGTGRS